MASRGSKPLIWIFAGLTAAVLLVPLGCDNRGADDSGRGQGNVEVVHLWTDGFATPLVIPGDPGKRSVTSLEIRGELPGDGDRDGKGTIKLGEGALTFNEFGDAAAAPPKAAAAHPVALRLVK